MNNSNYQIEKTIQKLERYAEYLESLVKEKKGVGSPAISSNIQQHSKPHHPSSTNDEMT